MWFNLVNSMWKKHRSTLQDYVKYTHNDILKPLRLGILQYTEHVQEMHGLAKCLPPPPMNGQEYDEADWAVSDK